MGDSILEDIQSQRDTRGVALQRVGIKDIALPLRVATKAGGHQIVHARCSLSVGLAEHFKGTHMSRFVELLAEWRERNLSGAGLEDLLREVCRRLEAKVAQTSIAFDYFVDKAAPVSGLVAPTDLACSFVGEIDAQGAFHFTLGVQVPVTTLCPCSKEISQYGAHNQRSVITARIRYRTGIIWIEDLAAGLEAQASCPVFPLLKREDEKAVTERAYDNPRFVEDLLRDSILYVRQLPDIEWFAIDCENFESIHHHNAWAMHEEWISG